MESELKNLNISRKKTCDIRVSCQLWSLLTSIHIHFNLLCLISIPFSSQRLDPSPDTLNFARSHLKLYLVEDKPLALDIASVRHARIPGRCKPWILPPEHLSKLFCKSSFYLSPQNWYFRYNLYRETWPQHTAHWALELENFTMIGEGPYSGHSQDRTLHSRAPTFFYPYLQ